MSRPSPLIHLPLNTLIANKVADQAGRYYPVQGTVGLKENGHLGRCLHFDGSQTQIQVPDADAYRLTQDLTISVWVNIEGQRTDWVRVLGKGNRSDRNYGLWYRATTNQWLLQIYSQNQKYQQVLFTSSDGIKHHTWYHLAGVRSGNKLALFLDGKKVTVQRFSVNEFAPRTSADSLTLGYAGFHMHHIGLLAHARVYNQALSKAEIVQDMESDIPALIFHFPMDGLTADQKLADISGRGCHGTLHGGVKIEQSELLGSCMSFDGQDDYVQLPAFQEDFSKGMTVKVWANYEAFKSWARIIDLGNGQNADNITFANTHFSSSLNAHVFQGAQAHFIEAKDVLSLHKWMHLGWVIDPGGESVFYLNGQRIYSSPLALPKSILRNSNYIGKSNWVNNQLFQGKMAHLRMYRRSLSQAEVQRDMQADQARMVFHFPMDSLAEGNTLQDISGNGLDGNLQGNPEIVFDPVIGNSLQFDGQNDYVQLPTLDTDFSSGLTIEAWVNFAAFQFWSRIVDLGNGPGKDNILLANNAVSGTFTAQVFSSKGKHDLSTQALVTNKWMHLAWVLDPKGKGHLYLDGRLLHSGPLSIPDRVLRTLNYIGKSNWGHDKLFKGKMAHLRLYKRPLSQAEITQDMQADQLAMAAFQRTHPLDMRFLNGDAEGVLYMDDHPAGQSFQLELRNTSGRILEFPKPSQAQASADHYHFFLHFRAGILLPENASLVTLSEGSWSHAHVHQADGSEKLYLLHRQGFVLPPNDLNHKVPDRFLTLNHLKADPSGGSRGTRIEVVYRQLRFAGDTQAIDGRRILHLNLVNHRGRRYLPLHVDFVGSNTILNDGSTTNTLRLRLTNQLKDNPANPALGTILLSKDANVPSSLTFSFDTSENADENWALGTLQQVSKITFGALSGWNRIDPSSGTARPEWVYKNTTQTDLRSGENLDIDISNIVTALPDGRAKLYLHYQNIPGYWDGTFICDLEKTPMVMRDQKLGLGANPPAEKFHLKDGNIKVEKGALKISDQSGNEHLHISETQIKQTANKSISIYTSNQERLRIEGTGNIGLGTSPGEKFHVKGGNIWVEQGQLKISDQAGPEGLHITEQEILQSGNKPIVIKTSNHERLRIQGNGNIGIGNNNPVEKIHVFGGNLRIDDGEIRSWGPITLHPDVDNSGDKIINLNGRIRINGKAPVLFRTYTDVPTHDLKNKYSTGVSSHDYTAAAIVGFYTKYDLEEKHSQDFGFYMEKYSGKWHIVNNMSNSDSSPTWHINVMFFMEEIVGF